MEDPTLNSINSNRSSSASLNGQSGNIVPVPLSLPPFSIKSIRNLVFEGGSVKGIGYVGTCQGLLEAGLDPAQIERIAGTSAGAITAMLLSVGYQLEDLEELMRKLKFDEFLDEKHGNVRGAILEAKDLKGSGAKTAFFASKASDSTLSRISSRLNADFGLFEGEYFRHWAEDRIKEKTKRKHLTFRELHALRLENPALYKDLYVVGKNINTAISETFSYEHTPDVIISDAVRISMSIPFVFGFHQVYVMKPGIGRVLDASKKDTLYVDGGITDNYPITLFDDKRYLPQALQADYAHVLSEKIANPTTLGFRLVDKVRLDYFEGRTTQLPAHPVTDFLGYTKAVLNSIYTAQENYQVRSHEQWRTGYVDTCGVGTLDFDLSPEKQEELIAAGKAAVAEFLARRNGLAASISSQLISVGSIEVVTDESLRP